MDQKDSTTHTKKLASASELRGKKSGMPKGKKGGGKMWISLLSMVVVLGVAVGIYFLSDVIKPAEEPVAETTLPPTNTVKVVDRKKPDVDRVTVKLKGEEPYTIVSEATTTGEGDSATTTYAYSVEGYPDFRLNESLASSIIGYAVNMTATQQVEEGVTDFSPYGLDDPTVTLTMQYRDGSKAVWLFGNQVPTGTGRYICQQGTQTVFAIYASAYTSISYPLNDLYVLEMPVTFADYSVIRDLVVEQKGRDTVELRYLEESENTFSISSLRIVQPIEYDAHGDRASEILTAVAALTIDGYAGLESELPEAGLDEPRAKIIATDADGNVLTYTVGNFCGNDSVYVQVDDSEAVYLTAAANVSFLDNVNVGYLVDQFANLVNILKVEEVHITTPNDQFDLGITRVPELDENGVQKTNSAGQPATVDTYFFGGEETTEDLFKDLYQVIIGTMVSKVTDEWNIQGETVVSVSYKLNEAPYEFTIEYIEYDDEYYAVRRNDLTLFLIKQDKIDNLITQMESFRDGTFVGN